MKYRVDISPDAKNELINYIKGAQEFGDETVRKVLEAYDECLDILENNPYVGAEKIKFLHEKYKMLHLWKHYWLIFQIYEPDVIKIDYVIDDRQDYGSFVH